MTRFFIDSCIFFAFAYPGKWTEQSKRFFGNGYHKYTGHRVNGEIERRLARRRELYVKMAKFLKAGGKPTDFDTGSTNKNDRKHFQDLLLDLAKLKPTEVLTYMRDKDALTRKGLAVAFGYVQKPLIPMSTDVMCEDIVQVSVDNRDDAKIFVDAYNWAETNGKATFATLDFHDFIRNRSQIHKSVCRYKSLACVDDLPIKISHLGEVV
ncbi:MAG: hypothetical protein NWE93_10100 [Candidatus Bathyarchaeota archaeon]|nr:hypothetical protein [Candidatus Bathyarchaeota archaeon]